MITRRKFLIGTFITFIGCTIVWLWESIQNILKILHIPIGKYRTHTDILLSSPPKEVMFYKKLPDKAIECRTCFKLCVVGSGKRGYCRVRENVNGEYISLVYALPAAIHIDPIEKEPQLHMLPGSNILCFGTAGCNFRCQHCHNWHLSQANPEDLEVYDLPPEKAVELAIERDIPTISFTYNEPIAFYEYVYDIAVLAKEKGLRILWHSNGSMTQEALKALLKYTDAVTIDLKGFTDKAYENSSAILKPVLDTLITIKQEGIWLEIVNLVIPTINDNLQDIKKMCMWIKENIGIDTPLHFSRFFPSYKLTHISPTPISTLEKAYQIAKYTGLQYVTIGNVPGHKYNSTFCPKCNNRLIHRIHFQVLKNDIINGKCRFCSHKIPGIWV